MKRDMDLCREILRQMEEFSEPLGEVEITVADRSLDEVNYHVYLLHQAGLIQAVPAIDGDEFGYHPLRLTWEGHEFLDAARDDTIWRKVKATVLERTGGLAFEVLKTALLAEISRRLGLGSRGA